MNALIDKLHVAARRYCVDRHHYWTDRYAEIVKAGRDRDGSHYTDDALRIFPRYNVLSAILEDIERFVPQDFSTLEEATQLISMVGHTAESIFTKAPNGPIEEETMNEERNAFVHFIQTLSEEALSKVDPLPYRRVLKTSESRQVWMRLKTAWGIQNGYWYPLADCSVDSVNAFQDKYLREEVGPDRLRTLLAERGITKVWELREYGVEYEMELAAFDPYYNGVEGYWCSDDMDWIIYASHESSITIGGWLLGEVKQVWPNCEERIWTTPFFD